MLIVHYTNFKDQKNCCQNAAGVKRNLKPGKCIHIISKRFVRPVAWISAHLANEKHIGSILGQCRIICVLRP